MKSVGKQLQEARLARNWTPELAARETKIKIDRVRDLEADDYTHFTSPAYARGFVRTYARSLGLDEYKILRQLDNKLPDDDTPNLVTDTGVAYLPETSMPPRVAHRDYTGLYVVMTLGFGVSLVIAFILFEAYRVGELPRYFANASTPEVAATDTTASTNGAPAHAEADAPPHALPVDPNDTTHAPKAEAVDLSAQPVDAGGSVKALPVNPPEVAASTNAAPTPDAPIQAVKALPVDPSEPAPASAPTTVAALTAPRALPVNPNDLAAAAPTSTAVPPAATPAPPVMAASASARQSNANPIAMPTLPPISPVTNAAGLAAATTTSAPQTASAPDAGKRLILTASQDSFVRVTALDSPDADKPLYASVLHSGQSVAFDGHKFSINVGVPSAVDIKLDGVNYGPHSDQDAPETFTVESHQP